MPTGHHLAVDCRLTFQSIDIMAEVDHFGFHLVVGSGIFSGYGAVGVAVGIEKRLRGIPGFCALVAQFKNLVHNQSSCQWLSSSSRFSRSAALMRGFSCGSFIFSLFKRMLLTAQREKL